jgi:hypothetical protein
MIPQIAPMSRRARLRISSDDAWPIQRLSPPQPRRRASDREGQAWLERLRSKP